MLGWAHAYINGRDIRIYATNIWYPQVSSSNLDKLEVVKK